MLLNFFAVSYHGESEFWPQSGKVVLIVGLIIYTFITMLDGNPEHDRYSSLYYQERSRSSVPLAMMVDSSALSTAFCARKSPLERGSL
jgi:amino acid permease